METITNSTVNGRRRERFYGWAAVIILWTTAFSMACYSDIAKHSEHNAAGSTIGRLLSKASIGLSQACYERADLYFHKGVPHSSKKALADSFYHILNEEINPSSHAHRHGRSLAEIMPWLKLVTSLDPGNIEARLNAVFLLMKMKEFDVAEKVLMDARRTNPKDHRVLLYLGRIYVKREKISEAGQILETALRFCHDEACAGCDHCKDTLIDKRAILLYLAAIDEAEGNLSQAVERLEAIIEIFPGSHEIETTIKALKKRPDGESSGILLEALKSHEEAESQTFSSCTVPDCEH